MTISAGFSGPSASPTSGSGGWRTAGGSVALVEWAEGEYGPSRACGGSERAGELVERGSDAQPIEPGVDAEFVVTAPQILHEGVAADHDRRGPVALQATHRPQPGLQPGVVALHPVVREARRVVAGVGEQLLDDPDQ